MSGFFIIIFKIEFTLALQFIVAVNLSGLTGYYASVKINNDSREKAEMFTISSGVSISSK